MAETTQYGAAMSWKEYVDRLAATWTNTKIAQMAGVTLGNVTKWRNGTQSADASTAIKLARNAGDDPLGLLVTLGYLTPAEANSRPAPAPDYSQLSNDELLQLVKSRMREVGGEHARGSASMKQAPVSGATEDMVVFNDEGQATVLNEPVPEDSSTAHR